MSVTAILSLALSALICIASESIAVTLNYPPAKFLMITVISVAFATLMPARAASLHGHYELGQILIYCFFAVIGVQINFVLALTEGGQIMLFTGILLTVHLVLLSLFGRVLKLSGAELAVASNACILSAPTAAAMAVVAAATPTAVAATPTVTTTMTTLTPQQQLRLRLPIRRPRRQMSTWIRDKTRK